MVDLIYQNPKSLYNSCIEYVASQLHLIESLVGFPEMIGREIFQAAKQHRNDAAGFFSFKSLETRKLIQVFFDAYGDGDILRSLSLDKAYMFFNDVIDDCWWMFQHLIHLDLSSCGIGDDHDVLSLLGEMQRLQTLVLRDNLLTNEGVRKLTVRSRMLQTSSSTLKFLDLSSNNGITVRTVSFLKCLPTLLLLNMSNTSIAFKDTVVLDDWQVCAGQDMCDCMTSYFLVRTEGWTADLLENWKLEYGLTKRISFNSVEPSTSIHGHRFYSSSRSVTKISNSISAHEPQKKNNAQLILMSHLYSCRHFQRVMSSAHSSPRLKSLVPSVSRKTFDHITKPQRKLTINQDQDNTLSPGLESAVTEYDNNESVLSLYRCSSPSKKLKRDSMLQQLDDFL